MLIGSEPQVRQSLAVVWRSYADVRNWLVTSTVITGSYILASGRVITYQYRCVYALLN